VIFIPHRVIGRVSVVESVDSIWVSMFDLCHVLYKSRYWHWRTSVKSVASTPRVIWWIKSGSSVQQVISSLLCALSRWWYYLPMIHDPVEFLYVSHQWLTCFLMPSWYSPVSAPPYLWMLWCCSNVIIIRTHCSTTYIHCVPKKSGLPNSW